MAVLLPDESKNCEVRRFSKIGQSHPVSSHPRCSRWISSNCQRAYPVAPPRNQRSSSGRPVSLSCREIEGPGVSKAGLDVGKAIFSDQVFQPAVEVVQWLGGVDWGGLETMDGYTPVASRGFDGP